MYLVLSRQTKSPEIDIPSISDQAKLTPSQRNPSSVTSKISSSLKAPLGTARNLPFGNTGGQYSPGLISRNSKASPIIIYQESIPKPGDPGGKRGQIRRQRRPLLSQQSPSLPLHEQLPSMGQSGAASKPLPSGLFSSKSPVKISNNPQVRTDIIQDPAVGLTHHPHNPKATKQRK